MRVKLWHQYPVITELSTLCRKCLQSIKVSGEVSKSLKKVPSRNWFMTEWEVTNS